MSDNVIFFQKISKCEDQYVRLAGGTKIKVQGIGDVNIVCNDDIGKHKLLLENVMYIPALKENLISVKE